MMGFQKTMVYSKLVLWLEIIIQKCKITIQTYVSWKLKVPTGQIPVGKSVYENEFLYNLEHLKEFKVK